MASKNCKNKAMQCHTSEARVSRVFYLYCVINKEFVKIVPLCYRAWEIFFSSPSLHQQAEQSKAMRALDREVILTVVSY